MEKSERYDVSVLSIYRPVLNISEAYVNTFIQQSKRHDFRPKNLTVVLSPDSVAEVISPQELRRLQVLLGIRATPEMNDELAEYLNDVVPDSYDDRLTTPTKPLKDYRRHGKGDSTIFTMATDNPVARQERISTQEAINEFYGIGKKWRRTHEEPWLDYEYRTDVRIGYVRNGNKGTQVVDMFRKFLEREVEYMPADIVLGPATIDDAISTIVVGTKQ
jgi:hypothetical protein